MESVETVNSDVPLSMGLELRDKYKMFVNNVQNVPQRPDLLCNIPLSRRNGHKHMSYTWNGPRRKAFCTSVQNSCEFTETFLVLLRTSCLTCLSNLISLRSTNTLETFLKTRTIVATLVKAPPAHHFVLKFHCRQKKIWFSSKNLQLF